MAVAISQRFYHSFTFLPANIPQNRNQVCWGISETDDCPDTFNEKNWALIQAKIIGANFASEITVIKLRNLKIEMLDGLSVRYIFKSALKIGYENFQPRVAIDFLIETICSTASLTALTYYSVKRMHLSALKTALLCASMIAIVNSFISNLQFPLTSLTERMMEIIPCTAFFMLLTYPITKMAGSTITRIAMVWAAVFAIVNLISGLESAVSKARDLKAQELYGGKKYIFVQDLYRAACSMHNTDPTKLANEPKPGGWEDPITLEVIPLAKIRSPRILKIGPYAFDIMSALQAVFTKENSIQWGKIIHPVENRYLTKEEQNKFLDDICAFFCILDRKELLDCWRIRLTEDDLDLLYDSFEWMEAVDDVERAVLKEEFEIWALPLKRTEAFLQLLPEEISFKYFQEFKVRSHPDALAAYNFIQTFLIYQIWYVMQHHAQV